MKSHKFTTKFFLVWSAVLYFFGYLATRYFPFTPTYPYYDSLLSKFGPGWLVRWAGFDGVHYLTIVQKGYIGTGLIQAFFPVYPYIVRTMSWFANPVILGLLLSAVSCFFALLVFTRLIHLEEKNTTTRRTILLALPFALLIFPTSFFFLAFYTESLFLLLALLAFFFARKKQWVLAALCAGIASGTRIIGVGLVPALMVEAYLSSTSEKNTKLPWKIWALLLLGTSGLLVYMSFLTREFHDPLYFLHVQQEFGGGRQENLILFPQVLFRYIKILLTVPPLSWSYFAYAQEFFLTGFAGVFLAIATIKHLLRPSYLLYSWFAYLVPPLTGTFQSMPRYLLVIFPLFMLFASLRVKKPRLFFLLILTHGILLLINLALFFQGKWVA